MKKVLLLFIFFTTGMAYGQVDLNLGLVAYYPFNGNANDVSGNNINGIVNNAALTTDRAGQANSAYYFNGATSYIQLPYSSLYNFAPSDSFTITVRVLPDQGYSWPAQSLVVKSPFNPDFNLSDWNYGSYILNYKAMSGYAFTNALVGSTVFTGTPCWYNIVTTYKNGIWKLYINGVLEDSDLSQTRYILQDGPASKINFGKKGDSNGDYYKGKMDDIRIYHRVLNQEEINILSGCSNIAPCDSWLKTQTVGSSIKVGDLDVAGDQITVEANINRIAPYTGSYIYAGDIVSKHTDPSDANYLLRPNDAEITTTNGYFVTPAICDIELNKTYHVALVYNGSTLKFYRNGFLMSQVPATGNLYQNNLITSIGDWANYITPVGTNFQGYINEVRIWNVARTQAQLQTYMNTSLPNPATQTGLQAYYTFDNLVNKQGNTAFNGSIAGAATINNTNTSCNFIADSCRAACNTWLSTPSQSSYVSVGDLDITGNKVTVEATINRTQPYLPGGGNNTEGDVVSKHTDPSDVNYLLRPNHAYITTTNGFFGTPDICDLELNKNYHVAMVYDGATLKFYRDGFLMSQVPATGNLFQNNLTTRIGLYPATFWNTQFIGYINEVRIWNVARTQAELQTYMNSSLPNPATQPGLQAYYTFDDLLNKQGNAAWDGVLGGSASINATNSNCSFTADSCRIINTSGISGIINDYTPVISLSNTCKNELTVEDGTHFNVGDTVLLIQMKGAVIDTTNTAAFGTILDYKNSGNYEYNYVKNRTGNIIELKNQLTRQYDIPTGKVQLIRVPYYNSVNVSATLTCLPWDGRKGGVLVFNVKDTAILNADIDVTGKGFRGGNTYNVGNAVLSCYQTGYFSDSASQSSSRKGEGITDVGRGKLNSRGHLANGGGGGNGHNSGGGGGSNIAIGGFGGYQLYECNNSNYDNRGIGGLGLTYSNAANKIYLGGGGGAGHKDGLPTEVLSSAGGDGGGIVIMGAKYLQSNTHAISANGAHGKQCDLDGFTCLHDGMGGGGGAGTILLNVTNYIDNHNENVIGGKGADLTLFTTASGHVAPGGGGGGGIVWFSSPALPANATVANTGGLNGTIILDSNNPFGSTAGQNGSNLFNLVLPADGPPFKPNIDSVRIKDSLTACRAFDFHGFGYTNTNPISSWDWTYGDGGTGSGQNSSHAYLTGGTFTVTLIVTDINGCKDSITKNVTTTNCITSPSISGIINDYTPVLALNPCNNKITVEDGTHFNIGDTVLIIQMKGAVIDSTNTAAFGTVTNYKNSGNYEFNYVKSKSGNIIELKNTLTRQYDIPAGKVQLVRVPYYNSVNVTATLTCLPWDGSKGGVLVLNAKDTVTMNADIDVSGNGFRGGAGYNSNTSFLTCFLNDYYYPVTHQFSGMKGESIAIISDNIIRGKGNLAGGGGGGLGHNSGGGGGGNGGTGGLGGYQLDVCGSAPFDNRGLGGITILNNTASNKIFLGSGGGAGQADNVGNIPPGGGNGGGLAIVMGNYLKSNSNKILANGNNGVVCTEAPGSDCHDGMGGGGAGGTVLLAVTNYLDNAVTNKNGGKGANVTSTVTSAGQIGPGGGGAGGVLFINKPSLPASVASSNTGGQNGTLALAGFTPWGSTPGSNGLDVFNLVIPIDNTPFKPNIDSVRIKDSATNCLAFDFHGFGYTNTNPISSWDWTYGDGGTGSGQNSSHTYSTAGTFTVTLIVTDINGCKDSITKNVISNTMSVDAGTDSSFCGGPASLQLHGNVTGSGNYSWTPAVYLNNSGIQNPTATVNATTTFYLTVTNSGGCTGKDSVTVHIDTIPIVKTLIDTSICRGSSLILTTTAGLGSYHWSPGISLNDSTIANPQFIDTTTTTLIVTGSNGACPANDTIIVTVKPLPIVNAGRDTTICSTQTVTLSASGASTYTWSPAIFLSNPNIANPVFSGNTSTEYHLSGIGANGCTGKDTVSVTVNNLNSLVQPPDKSLCLKDTVHLDGNNGNTVLYLWAPPTYLSNTTIINPVANPPGSTSYTVTVTDTVCHYSNTFTVAVTVRPLPVVDAAKSNDIDCARKNAHLTASGAIHYTWEPSPTLSSTTIANPVATPTDNTLYIVTGTDNTGCKNKDSVTVLVKDGINAYAIPNSFTPNGDGHNDCFGIKNWGDAKNVYFIIYNRWGEKVFETNNVTVCWDGKYKGQPADAGNYVFYARAITACGEMVQKGNVLLIR